MNYYELDGLKKLIKHITCIFLLSLIMCACTSGESEVSPHGDRVSEVSSVDLPASPSVSSEGVGIVEAWMVGWEVLVAPISEALLGEKEDQEESILFLDYWRWDYWRARFSHWLWRVRTGGYQKCFGLASGSEFLQDEAFECQISGVGFFPSQKIASNSGKCCVFLPEGKYWIEGLASGWRSEKLGFEVKSGLNEVGALRFFRTRRLLVSALDMETLEELPDVFLTLSDSPLHVGGMEAVTDSEGYAQFDLLLTKKYYIQARSSYYMPILGHLIDFTQYTDEVDPQFTVFMSHGLILEASTYTSWGVPVTGCTLHLVVYEGSSGERLWDSHRDVAKSVHPLSIGREIDWTPESSHFTQRYSHEFFIAGVPKGKIEFYATCPQFSPSNLVRLESAEEARDVEHRLVLGESHRLFGRVVNEQKAGIQAEIRTRNKNYPHWSNKILTDKDGYIEFTDLGQDTEFEVFAAESKVQRYSFDVSEVREYEFVVSSGFSREIRGRVYSEGGVLGGVEVSGVIGDSGELCTTKTDSGGEFVLRGCSSGDLVLEFRLKNYAPRWILANTQEPLDVEMEVGRVISANFVDSQAESLAGVICRLEYGDGSFLGVKTEVVLRDGRWEEGNISSQLMRIICEKDGYSPYEIHVDSKMDLDLGEIVLTPWIRVEGYVLDTEGSPVSGARIFYEGGSGGCERSQILISDASGFFFLGHQPSCVGSLVASHWLYGRGVIKVDGRSGVGGERYNIRLGEDLGEDCVILLKKLGFSFNNEGRARQFDDIPEGYDSKIERGDYFESCQIFKGELVDVTYVRGGSRLKLRI